MKTKLLLILLLIVAVSTWFAIKVTAQPACDWANGLNGMNSTDESAGHSVAVDGSGNSYVTGAFKGVVDFDPTSGSFYLVSSGGYDIFLAKYDINGAFQWAMRMGGAADDFGYAIALDPFGEPVITGTFQGSNVSFDFNNSTIDLTSNGDKDIFVAKYQANGDVRWAFNVGGTQPDNGYSISVDGYGNVYITGSFQDVNVDFDPSSGTAYLQSPSSFSGTFYDDIFIAKYSSNGNYRWGFSINGMSVDAGRGIAADAFGNIYVTGYFFSPGNIDFDPGSGIHTLLWHGRGDAFIAKYDSAGNYQWAGNIGGPQSGGGYTWGYAVAINRNPKDEAVYITGKTENGKCDFDPSLSVVQAGLDNGGRYVLKFNQDGAYQWLIMLKALGDERSFAIDADVHGGVFVAGGFPYPAVIDLDYGASAATFNSAGGKDAFVSKYNSAGQYQWGFTVGGTEDDIANSVAVSNIEDVYLTGSFQSSNTDFEPSNNSINLTATGNSDAFVAKYAQPVITGISKPDKEKVKVWNSGNELKIDASVLTEKATLIINSLEGREILTKTISPKQQYSIDINNIAQGLITVRIFNSNYLSIHKIPITKL